MEATTSGGERAWGFLVLEPLWAKDVKVAILDSFSWEEYKDHEDSKYFDQILISRKPTNALRSDFGMFFFQPAFIFPVRKTPKKGESSAMVGQKRKQPDATSDVDEVVAALREVPRQRRVSVGILPLL